MEIRQKFKKKLLNPKIVEDFLDEREDNNNIEEGHEIDVFSDSFI
jgi:hypothetical protein